MIAAPLALAAALQIAPIDWAALPALPYRVPPAMTVEMHRFAGREAQARRCPVKGTPRRGSITVDVAVLVEGNGEIRTAIPRAIRCPTVEQYAAGLATGFARGNLLPRASDTASWYRTSLTFSWQL